MFEKSEVNAVLNQFNRAKSFIDKDGLLVRLSVVKDDEQLVYTVSSTNIGTLGKYEQRRL